MQPDFDKVEHLFRTKEFGLARRHLLGFVGSPELTPETALHLVLKLAFATYKDNELRAELALDMAHRLLCDRADLASTVVVETLNLAGAIQKRVWTVSGDARALTRSLRYYRRARAAGLAQGDRDGWAYSTVNVAFVLDLMAHEEATACAPDPSERAEALRDEAKDIRRSICERDNGSNIDAEGAHWWRIATLAEAHFGLGEVGTTSRMLADAVARFAPDDWQRESVARQLAALASVRYKKAEARSHALDAIAPLVTGAAAEALVAGKLGLALSGGGFRAALFHVGTLARLAELDLLRHVDVISCVSGGSILGALYYLVLQDKLRTVSDVDMTRADYVEVVASVRERLVEAVRNDIRTRAMVRSVRRGFRNRTLVTGSMLGSALYATRSRPNPTLAGLVFTPRGHRGGDFNPKQHNWRRNAKVPILIINATTLNTGHNWQFTARWMGEPPTYIEPEIDAGERLRRLYVSGQAPRPHDATPIWLAVAASAAVPGVFPPLRLDGLYPGRSVRLSDGGVHDNQGVFGLVEQDCTSLIVSDGCGQLDVEPRPRSFAPYVLKRANDILMDAVRRSTFRNLLAGSRSRRLRELRFLHLRAGLTTYEVTWIGGAPAPSAAMAADGAESGLDERVQRALAAIRTDLDDFSSDECDGLMFAGYRIADLDFRARPSALGDAREVRESWPFLRVQRMAEPGADGRERDDFADALECGRYSLFRKVRLYRPVRWLRRRYGSYRSGRG